jgi:ribonuclease P protein component
LIHLKNRAQFQAVLNAVTMARTTHFALHVLALDPSPLDAASRPLFALPGTWIGVMAPKRWARRAVTRNTIKRQILAVSREFEPLLPAAAHVVRLRCAFERAHFTSATSTALKKAVRLELRQLFERATQIPARVAA